jgi:hypothetical protein
MGRSVLYLLESLINDIWMLEVIICEEVELVEEVSDVYAGERIHLRERENTWNAAIIST